MSNARNLANLLGTDTQITTADIADAAFQANKNLVINGAMQVAQRGTSVTGVAGIGYNTVDRWENAVNTAGTYTISQDTNSPNGFSNSIKYLCTVADASLAASDYVTFRQKLEGQDVQHLQYGSSGAKTVTASFWVKSNVTGTYTLSLEQESPAGYYNVHTYTINTADTWEYKTVTFAGHTVAAITNNNAAGIELQYWLAAGSSFTSGTDTPDTWTQTTGNRVNSSQVNLSSAVNNYWQITGIQLELGSTATPFAHESYEVTLQKAQRYYQHLGAQFHGKFYQSTKTILAGQTIVTMRAAPTVTIESKSITIDEMGVAPRTFTSSAGALYGVTKDGIGVYDITGTHGGTVGNLVSSHGNFFKVDAEL